MKKTGLRSMRKYIIDEEIERVLGAPEGSLQKKLYQMIRKRVEKNTVSDSIRQKEDIQQEWYYFVWERMSDASFVYRVTGEESLGRWIHNRIMELVSLPEDAWIGPWFRPRPSGELTGTLETAYIALAICEACLNAQELFSKEEWTAILKALSHKALVLLKRHVDRLYAGPHREKSNWYMVTNCAYGITAAVLEREEEVRHALDVLQITLGFFNKDSYGETLHYAEMASTYISHLCEVLYRLGYIAGEELPLEPVARMIPWYAASIQQMEYSELYDAFVPYAFNFGDANLSVYFQADKLVQIAARFREKCPREAALAAWLFGLPFRERGNGEREYCWDYYGYSYHALLLLPNMAKPSSPKASGLPCVRRFATGHVIARDRWEQPRAMVAIAAGGDPMNVAVHRHQDQNSFLLTVGKERMLVDPGACCYRLRSQQISKSEISHSVLSLFRGDSMLQQRLVASKERGGGGNGLNIFENFQDTWVVASDGAKLYEGDLVKKAVRIWVLCLPGMMFVADYVLSEEPLRLSSGFVMNNEDNRLNTHIYNPSRLVFRRGAEAVKLFLAKHVVDKAEADSELSFDWTFVHRRYGVQPNGPEQGREGSGLIYRWTGKTEGREQYRIHGLMMDREEMIKEWHMREEGGFIRLEAPDHENTLDFQFTPEGFAVRRHGLTGYWVL